MRQSETEDTKAKLRAAHALIEAMQTEKVDWTRQVCAPPPPTHTYSGLQESVKMTVGTFLCPYRLLVEAMQTEKVDWTLQVCALALLLETTFTPRPEPSSLQPEHD